MGPDPEKMRERYPADGEERHFRGKRISRPPEEQELNCKRYQADVHEKYYSEYCEAKVIEVMTAALLNDLVNGEPRMLVPVMNNWNYLRCVEPNGNGGRVLVGSFHSKGLGVEITLDLDDSDEDLLDEDDTGFAIHTGYALTWKL